MEIVVIGLNHRTASLEMLEHMTFSKEQAPEAAAQICSLGLLKESVVLSTCNRTEIYGVPNGHGNSTTALQSFFYSYHNLPKVDSSGVFYDYTGRNAVRHIYRVASGLDSMMLGEAEILGQVREAYRSAFNQGTTGRSLNRLFQSALEVGKHIRTDTGIASHPMSVAFAGVKLAERVLSSLKERRVLVLGAGATSEKVLRHLCDRGVSQIRILNRTAERARGLAERYGGEVVPWKNLRETLEWPDLVVTSVSSPEPVLTREMLGQAMEVRGDRVLMLIDLAIPRNVSSNAVELANVYLYNIDHLEEIVSRNRKARESEIPHAEAIIEGHIGDFMLWQAGLSACSMLKDLRAKTQVDRDAFLRKHAEAMADFSSEERAHVLALLKKFLNESGPGHGNSGEDDAELTRRLQALSALCGPLDHKPTKHG